MEPEFVETGNLRNHVVFNYHRGRSQCHAIRTAVVVRMDAME